MSKTILTTGSALMALAVMLGAFGAHGLESFLEANGMKEPYQTGVSYHFYHALGMLGLGLAIDHEQAQGRRVGRLRVAAWLLFAGTLMFSGSLYALALTGAKFFGPITPLGGVAFIVGWALAGYGFATRKG